MSTLTSNPKKEAALAAAMYTKADVAGLMQLSEKSVDRMNVPGRVKQGRSVRFVRAVVDCWISHGCPTR